MLAACWIAAFAAVTPAALPAKPAGKVHPSILEAAPGETVELLVVLGARPDLGKAATMPSRAERGKFVVEQLRDTAARSQASLVELLAAEGVEHRSYWIANMVWVRGSRELAERIARRPEVLRISPNPRTELERPRVETGPGKSGAIEWNLTQINADQVWALGFTGEGAVIAGQDTGYFWAHPALLNQYRGFDGSEVSHDYNWHDAIHSGGGSCGADAPEPCDDGSHGTHTMGIMVGDDGGTNRIGVSPGARWIGCRCMDQSAGTPATYTECFQWFVAPTDANGENPDPSKAPHVINNSWVCPGFEGCDFDTLLDVVENVRAAGIVVVASTGNSGSSCSSVQTPPAIYEASFSVGATDSNDTIAGFSSRGPVIVDGSQRLKPDLTAPGVGIRSSVPFTGYQALSGTSMSGPHIAGVVALLIGAQPQLAGRVEEIEYILRQSSVPRTSTQTCGDVDGMTVPNNTYGWGRIDALTVVRGDADGDDVNNVADCRPADASTWMAPGEARAVVLEQVEGVTEVSWSAPANPGGDAPGYRVLRSTSPSDFASASCLAGPGGGTVTQDADVPENAFYYLIRAENACGTGPLGFASGGSARSGAVCP